MPPADLSTIEASLRLAARRYNEARLRELEREVSMRELEGLLRRFDCDLPMDADRTIDSTVASFAPEVSAELKRRCADALKRLARHARSADPRYDINRHMAIKRLALWLAGTAPWYASQSDRARHSKRRHRKPRPAVAHPFSTTFEAARPRT